MFKKIVFMFLIVAGCVSSTSGPDSSLKKFIELNFSGTASRDEILSMISGKMKESFEALSEDDFKKVTQFGDYDKQSFKIISKNCSEKQCYITYSLSFKGKNPSDQSDFKTEVKKIAELNQVDGNWLISDVSNVKTYLEALDPINVSN